MTITHSPLLTVRFESALIYANQLHTFQVRKGSGIPYISHLLSVAALVLEMGGDEDEAIAALLHDAVEDQGGAKTREVIRQKFGDRVVEIVDACSDSETIPKPPWRQRKEAYLEKIQTASAAVRRVSLADKLHNSRSTLKDAYLEGHEIWKKFNASKEETLWFYGSLLKIYREKDSGFLIDELERILNELEKV
jgi:(p)ppGpp synthase/HD superfamily hydrolase